MITVPRLEFRMAQSYVAIRTRVGIPFGEIVPSTLGEVSAWLGKKGVTPMGPPFIRYIEIDMTSRLDIEMGWTVPGRLQGEGRILDGILPAGRYAVTLYTGPYEGLMGATAELLAWAEKNQLSWKMSPDGKTWGAQLEVYLTDSAKEPDPHKWNTELAFLVADE